MVAGQKDTRVVYGSRCTWWDTIDKVGIIETGGHRLPVCPHCKRPLFEMDNMTQWMKRAHKYAEVHPESDYLKFLNWVRGKCYPTVEAAREIYNALPPLQKAGLPEPMANKTQEMKDGIDALFPGTKVNIQQGKCPICQQPIKPEDFKDALSRKEFGISGMCQGCQDETFGSGHDED